MADPNMSVDSVDLSFDEASGPPSPMRSQSNVTLVDVDAQKVVALSDYKAEELDDLCFKEGDVITITRKDGAGWAEGSLEDGSKGWFPLDKVEKVYESPVAEVGQDTGVSALDAFIQEAKTSKPKARLLKDSGGKPKLDKRDSLRIFLATRPVKEQLVEAAILPSTETTEQVQAAQKRLVKLQKKKKKKADLADKIASGWEPSTSGNPFANLTEEQFDRVVLSLIDIPVSKQKHGFSSYEDVFSGATLVTHLRSPAVASIAASLKDITADAAKALANLLYLRNAVINVEGQKKEFKMKGLYQASCLQTDYTCVNLNKVAVGAPPNAYAQSVKVVTEAIACYNEFLPDFEKLRSSKALHGLSLSLAELQNCTVADLSDVEKKSFFVNCFNALVLYAHAKFTPPTNTLDKRYLYEHVTLLTNKRLYSLQDLEASALAFATKEDPAVYFCLSDGTKSTPACFVFTKDDFKMTNLYAARSFLDKTVVVDGSDYAITVPKICQRLWKDLGLEKDSLVKVVQQYLARVDREEIDRLLEVGPLDIKFDNYHFDVQYAFEEAAPLSPR